MDAPEAGATILKSGKQSNWVAFIIPTFIIPTVGIMNVVCRYFEIAP